MSELEVGALPIQHVPLAIGLSRRVALHPPALSPPRSGCKHGTRREPQRRWFEAWLGRRPPPIWSHQQPPRLPSVGPGPSRPPLVGRTDHVLRPRAFRRRGGEVLTQERDSSNSMPACVQRLVSTVGAGRRPGWSCCSRARWCLTSESRRRHGRRHADLELHTRGCVLVAAEIV